MSATYRIKKIDEKSVSPTTREIREKRDQVPSSDEAIREPGSHQTRWRRFSLSREGAQRSRERGGGIRPGARCCAGACARHGGCAAQPFECSPLAETDLPPAGLCLMQYRHPCAHRCHALAPWTSQPTCLAACVRAGARFGDYTAGQKLSSDDPIRHKPAPACQKCFRNGARRPSC